MIRMIALFTMGVLVSLSVNGQCLNWSGNSELQQPPEFNSRQTATQRLDSIIYYGYDEESEEWSRKRYRVRIFFDDFSNDTLILQSTWDVTTDSWLHRAKEVKKYDENNRIVSREFHLIARSATRIDYGYNENDDLIEMTESYFKSGEWRFKQRNAYSYNSECLLQADTLYHRYSSSGESHWRQIGITDFYYTEEGCPLSDTTYVRPWLSRDTYGDWELFSKTTHAYWLSENSAEKTISRWDKDSKLFRPFSKEQIRYHNDGVDLDAKIDLKWNVALSLWDTTEMKQYAYSNDDFIISYQKQTWGENSNKVLELFDYDYSVNNDELLLLTSALDAIPHIAFHHKIIRNESFRFNSGNEETQKFRETRYFYSNTGKATSIKLSSRPDLHVMVYPNPASEYIIINFPVSYQKAKFELFDVNGKEVLSKSVTKDERINVSQLKGGLYVYRFEVDSRMFAGKLLVK